MIGSKKVIKGLELHMQGDCMQHHREGNYTPEEVCPYFFDELCLRHLCEDAIELLKEQDNRTCTNCTHCKTQKPRGVDAWYLRCKKHEIWVKTHFYCADWELKSL